MTQIFSRLRGWRGFVLAFLLAIPVAACETPPPMDVAAPASPPASTEYHLGAGDKVRIHVFGDDTLSGEHQIDGRGAFTFPLVGAIAAGGLTSTQLESILETKLKEYMRVPNVSVEILNYRPFYIVGEIRQPGSYPYVDGMTVVNAVAIAGGFTYRARENEFVIQRKPSGQISARPATPVLPGDVIIVRERFF